MTTLLKANNISKTYGLDEPPVLDNISLYLESNTITCLLGASGCGKTTLLNILSGIDTEYQGEIESIIERPGPDVGYMTQGNELLPWRDVSSNVAIGLEFHKTTQPIIDQRVEDYLSLVHLSSYAQHYPKALSGGMRQRVALARTLVMEPKLLLLDEPLGSLDIVGRRRLGTALKNYVRKYDCSALVVTHSVEEAVYLGDRVNILSPRPAKIVDDIEIAACGEKAYTTVLSALLKATPEGQNAA